MHGKHDTHRQISLTDGSHPPVRSCTGPCSSELLARMCLFPLPSCPSALPNLPWMPNGRVGRTLAHDLTKISDVWTEMDASALRKLVPVWRDAVVQVTVYFSPFAESHVFLCGCQAHFNLDFMFHASLMWLRVNALTPIFWECLPLSVSVAVVHHPSLSYQLWLCPPHRTRWQIDHAITNNGSRYTTKEKQPAVSKRAGEDSNAEGADSLSTTGTSPLLVQASEKSVGIWLTPLLGVCSLFEPCPISKGSWWGQWRGGSRRIGWLKSGFLVVPRPGLPSRMWGCQQRELHDRFQNQFFPVEVLRELKSCPVKIEFHKVSLVQDFSESLIYQTLSPKEGYYLLQILFLK